jgi:hypothetical protein
MTFPTRIMHVLTHDGDYSSGKYTLSQSHAAESMIATQSVTLHETITQTGYRYSPKLITPSVTLAISGNHLISIVNGY